jgi:bifunctional ADP-heptose synthase (sugar kinase/adenylyltransferase)
MKILVIGDSCKDIYKYGVCDRLDQEAPVPVFREEKSTIYEGMSHNVANNIASYGAECTLITNKKNINKIRYLDSRSNQMVMRVDEDDKVARIKSLNNIKFQKYDAVIVSDYNKGFLTKKDMEYVSKNAQISFLQTNKILSTWCQDFSFIKLNNYEYANTSQFISTEFLDNLNLIITKGENGASYKGRDFEIKKPVMTRSLAGAGDTFLAALVINYLKHKSINKAILFAQNASKKAVSEFGITVIGEEKSNLPKVIRI